MMLDALILLKRSYRKYRWAGFHYHSTWLKFNPKSFMGKFTELRQTILNDYEIQPSSHIHKVSKIS